MTVTHAPYSSGGELLSYPSGIVQWRPIIPFRASLTFVGHGRGRSAVTFNWRDEDGHVWPMFVTDLAGLLGETVLDHGRTPVLTWTVRKRGANYGIHPVSDDAG